MARVFIYDGRKFDDPNPNLSIDEVRQHMANFFPELSNAEQDTKKEGGDDVTTFRRRVGTKGGETPENCKERCRNCRYAEFFIDPANREPVDGYCHRFPPLIPLIGTTSDFTSDFPTVDCTDWCGEFELEFEKE